MTSTVSSTTRAPHIVIKANCMTYLYFIMHKITTLLVPFTHTTQLPPPQHWNGKNVTSRDSMDKIIGLAHIYIKKQWKSNAVKCKTFCKVTFILIKPHYTMVCQKTLFWLAGRCALKMFNVQVVPSQFNHRSILIHCFNWCTQTHTHHLHTNTHIFNLNRLQWLLSRSV